MSLYNPDQKHCPTGKFMFLFLPDLRTTSLHDKKFVEHTNSTTCWKIMNGGTTYLHRVRDSISENGHHLASVVNHTEYKNFLHNFNNVIQSQFLIYGAQTYVDFPTDSRSSSAAFIPGTLIPKHLTAIFMF
jgi:hypothetical protein